MTPGYIAMAIGFWIIAADDHARTLPGEATELAVGIIGATIFIAGAICATWGGR